MTPQEFQALLPPGFDVIEPCSGAGAFGQVYVISDRRLASASNRLIARRVPVPAGQESRWLVKLEQRLAQLGKIKFLPHVSLPRSGGRLADGSLLILSPLHERPVASELGAERGLCREAAQLDQCVEQLLQGLAALHRHSIFHGDLRPQNLFLDAAGDQQEALLWIGDTAIGPLAAWSEREMFDGGVVPYLPPEWQKRSREPTAQADLYALGRTICALASGNDGDSPLPLAVLTSGQASQPTRSLVRRLLAENPAKRPVDAAEAYAIWQGFQESPRKKWDWGCIAVFVVMLLIVAWLALNPRYEQQFAQERSEKEAAQSQLSLLYKELDKSKKSSAELSEELRVTNKKLLVEMQRDVNNVPKESKVQPPPATVADVAQQLWKVTLGNLSQGPPPKAGAWNEQLDRVTQRLSQPFAKEEAGVRNKLSEYQKAASMLCVPGSNSGGWYELDPKQRQLVQDALSAPWDSAKIQAVKAHLAALGKAHETWNGWALDESLTPDDLEKEIERKLRNGNPQIKLEGKVLDEWWFAISTPRKWRLHPISGTSQKDWGPDHKIWIYSGVTTFVFDWHPWSASTSHAYKPTDVLQLDWKPGDPIRVVMESGSTIYRVGARPNLIDHKITGPLAIWTLRHAKLNNADSSLTVEISDCPGPPLELPWKKSR